MIKTPSSRKRKKAEEKLNLVPIMDSIFIFIFFLLMSSTFLKIYEINSDVPIISDAEPPKDQKDPLALSMKIDTNEITVSKGVPSRPFQTFKRGVDGLFNYEEIHTFLLQLKKQHSEENTIIFEPVGELTYEELVRIMDEVRMIKRTDEAIFKMGKDGVEEKVQELFNKIIFSNLMS
jgi:biopolymer transport protein ExbD